MLSRFALNRFGDGSNHSERKSTWLQSVVRKLLLRQHQSVVVRRLQRRLLQSVVVVRRLLSKLAPELQKKPGCICAGLFSLSKPQFLFLHYFSRDSSTNCFLSSSVTCPKIPAKASCSFTDSWSINLKRTLSTWLGAAETIALKPLSVMTAQ